MRVAAMSSVALLSTCLAGQSTLSETRAAILDLGDDEYREQLDAAAERGLVYLAARQHERGYWTGHVGHKRGERYLVSTSAQTQEESGRGHVGVSSLAALAFLAGGNLPGRGSHGDVVARALDYVLGQTEENGFITDSSSRMYSHAFATLFLSQMHGMAREKRLELALERAVHWIVDCQNHQGAWRYNAFSLSADLSVTVCQLQALRAARNIGIRVPSSTIERAVDYVRRSRTPDGFDEGLYYYKIEGRGAYRKNRHYAINAAALTSLASAGVYDEKLSGPTLAFLEEEYPYLAEYYPHHYFFWYGNYYASQAFFHAGGGAFERYHRRICLDLLEQQRSDGSWYNDVGPGDEFSTAVATLILLIPRQYLPIFQR